eukprot:1270106-Amphidinium_carterae.1
MPWVSRRPVPSTSGVAADAGRSWGRGASMCACSTRQTPELFHVGKSALPPLSVQWSAAAGPLDELAAKSGPKLGAGRAWGGQSSPIPRARVLPQASPHYDLLWQRHRV